MKIFQNYIYFLFALWTSLTIGSCVPPSKDVKSDISFKMDNPSVIKLINFQDQLMTDSLYPYLREMDPALRYLALRGMASIQSPKAIDSVAPLLKDPIIDVRAMAAYALGQIGEEKAIEHLVSNFIDQDTLDVDNILNAQILESLGKIGNKALMENIAAVESYRSDDSLLLLGQARALYRFGLNGIKSENTTKAIMKQVMSSDFPYAGRLYAANYLVRNNNLDLTAYKGEYLGLLRRENNANIRMCLALGLRNFKEDPTMIQDIINQIEVEKDYRVKVYLIKALSYFPYINVIEQILAYIKDDNIHVSSTAAQYLVDHADPRDIYIYQENISNDIPWQTKSIMYQAIMKNTPLYYTRIKNQARDQLLKLIQSSNDVYAKAAYYKAISKDPYQYSLLVDSLSSEKNYVIKSALSEGLSAMIKEDNFVKAFGGNYINVARMVADTMISQGKKGHVASAYYLSDMIQNAQIDWVRTIRDTSWQQDLLKALQIPKDLETYNEVQKAIAKFNGETYQKDPITYTNPIDWARLSTIRDSSRLVMKTTKGNITFKFFPKTAPGSVANFVKLCESDYYDGKVFHRVVPNFVIQGGCPIGDGLGSLDYTIRSELGPSYYDEEGYLGMASAGKDTEGVQFFVTHSPTPHLDGRYTIFGKVVEGMDVVHSIQVGDQIIDAILVK